MSGLGFCPSRLPWQDEHCEGPGTPLPVCAVFLLLACPARALASRALPCRKSSFEMSHCPKAQGCAGCAQDQTAPVGERADGRTALRGCYDVMRQKSTSRGVVTCASTL